MSIFKFFFARAIGCASGAAILLMGACQQVPISVQPELAAATAAGLEHAIVFERVGAPIDLPDLKAPNLTIAEATEWVIRTHPEIQAALSRVRGAQAEAHQTRLLPNPILTIVLRLPESGGSPIIEASIAAELLAELQRPGRIATADNRLRAVSAQVVSKVLDVVEEVKQRYHSVQESEASLPLLQDRRALILRLLELARGRLAGGEGTRLDLVTLDAERVDIESEIADVKLKLVEDRIILTRLIGRPSGTMNWRVASWSPSTMNHVAEAAWISAALEHRPELLEFKWELDALGMEVRLTEFGWLAGSSIGINAEKDSGWSVGPAASVPIPIFDWGQARKKLAESSVLETRHRLTQAQREIVEQVRRSVAVFNDSMLELKRVRTELIPLQEQRRELAEAAFRAGQSDITTVIIAEQALAAARARIVQLEHKNASALVRLERAVGGAAVAAQLVRPPPESSEEQPSSTLPATTSRPAPLSR